MCAASCISREIESGPLRAQILLSTGLLSPVRLHCEGPACRAPGFLVEQDRAFNSMLLPMISTAREALSSTLLGRLLGPSPSSNERRNDDESAEPLPPLKFTIGQEPNTPRAGSPGFQDGHWVRFFCGGSDSITPFLVWGCIKRVLRTYCCYIYRIRVCLRDGAGLLAPLLVECPYTRVIYCIINC